MPKAVAGKICFDGKVCQHGSLSAPPGNEKGRPGMVPGSPMSLGASLPHDLGAEEEVENRPPYHRQVLLSPNEF
jgi:hypothetical protein